MTHPIRPLLLAAALGASAPCLAQSQAVPPAAGGAVETVTVHATAHFDFDRTTVLPADQQRLLAEVATMKDVTWRTVVTEGHADSVGSAAYNERLSLRRAQAVRTYLIGQGIAPAMVSATGAGTAQPVADNDSPEGRARNRRTEVTFEGIRPTVASAAP